MRRESKTGRPRKDIAENTFKSSGTWRYIVWGLVLEVSKNRVIFMVKDTGLLTYNITKTQPFRWRATNCPTTPHYMSDDLNGQNVLQQGPVLK